MRPDPQDNCRSTIFLHILGRYLYPNLQIRLYQIPPLNGCPAFCRHICRLYKAQLPRIRPQIQNKYQGFRPQFENCARKRLRGLYPAHRAGRMGTDSLYSCNSGFHSPLTASRREPLWFPIPLHRPRGRRFQKTQNAIRR